MGKEFMSVSNLAESLGVSRVTIRNAIRKGELKSVRFNRKYLISIDEFNAFISSKRV